ncbi:hypothetical protein ADUPG1_003124, partial [Aduncisulcus paluster]
GHYANKCPLKAVKKEGELKVIESTSTDMAVHRRISLQADKGSSKIELQALVDSGASHSVISANVVEDLGTVQKYPCEVTFTLATGDKIEATHRVRLTVIIEGALGKLL